MPLPPCDCVFNDISLLEITIDENGDIYCSEHHTWLGNTHSGEDDY